MPCDRTHYTPQKKMFNLGNVLEWRCNKTCGVSLNCGKKRELVGNWRLQRQWTWFSIGKPSTSEQIRRQKASTTQTMENELSWVVGSWQVIFWIPTPSRAASESSPEFWTRSQLGIKTESSLWWWLDHTVESFKNLKQHQRISLPYRTRLRVQVASCRALIEEVRAQCLNDVFKKFARENWCSSSVSWNATQGVSLLFSISWS